MVLAAVEVVDELVEFGYVAGDRNLLELWDRSGFGAGGLELGSLVAGGGEPGSMDAGAACVRAAQAHGVLRDGSADDVGAYDADGGGRVEETVVEHARVQRFGEMFEHGAQPPLVGDDAGEVAEFVADAFDVLTRAGDAGCDLALRRLDSSGLPEDEKAHYRVRVLAARGEVDAAAAAAVEIRISEVRDRAIIDVVRGDGTAP